MKRNIIGVLILLLSVSGVHAQIIKPVKGKQMAQNVAEGFNQVIDAISQDVKPTGTHNVLSGCIYPKAGLALSTLTGMGGDMKLGFTAGFGLEAFIHPRVSVGLEVDYARQGVNNTYYNIDSQDQKMGPYDYTLDYVTTSLIGRWYVRATMPLSIYSGFSFQRCIKATFSGSGEKEDLLDDSHVRKGDVSIPIGATYEFGQWAVDLRYSYSFLHLAKSKNAKNIMGDASNMKIEATVAYRINIF